MDDDMMGISSWRYVRDSSAEPVHRSKRQLVQQCQCFNVSQLEINKEPQPDPFSPKFTWFGLVYFLTELSQACDFH